VSGGGELPRLHFRIREGGAQVFRLGENPRDRHLQMEPLATVSSRSGEIRPQGDSRLSEAERAEIAAWIDGRRSTLAARERAEMERMVERLGQLAHWAQSRAEDETLEALTEPLLLAMHDLRAVLVRRQAERLERRGRG